jgi:hypothetical protein
MDHVQYSDIDQREPDRLVYFPYVRSYIDTLSHTDTTIGDSAQLQRTQVP